MEGVTAKEFDNNINAIYSFSNDMPSIAANMIKLYDGPEGDALEYIQQALTEAKKI